MRGVLEIDVGGLCTDLVDSSTRCKTYCPWPNNPICIISSGRIMLKQVLPLCRLEYAKSNRQQLE